MIDLFHFEDADDELIAKITKQASVAQSAEFLQSAWAAAMVVVEK